MPWNDKKNGRWIARVMVDGKRTQVGVAKTKKEALALEAEYRAERKGRPSELTINQLRKRWLRDYGAQAGWRESTRLHNEERTRKFVKAHGRRRVSNFEVMEAYQWATEHPSSLNALRAMFAFGRNVGARRDNPFSALPSGKTKVKDIRRGRGALTEEEVWALADMALRLHGEWHRAFVLFAAYTGLRAGELYGLKFSDLRADTLLVSRSWNQKVQKWVLPKNGKEREVIYPRQAREALARVERGVSQEFVFVSPTDREHLTPTSHYYHWHPLRDAWTMGLPSSHWVAERLSVAGDKLKFHELRHTCATLLLERGVDHDAVATQLGHANARLVLSTYGHPNKSAALDRVRAALDRPVSGEAPALRKVEGGNAS